MIASVFRLTMPLSPKAGFGFPDLASNEYSFPSADPNTTCAGVVPSPLQNSSPRVEGLPDGSGYDQISLPVTGSTAATREYGVVMYIRPSIASGVFPLGRNPEPNMPRRPPPPPPAGGSGVSPTAPPGPRPSIVKGPLPPPVKPSGRM